jgi:hypothetical protein
VDMDEEYMPIEEETPGEYVAAGLGLHVPKELGGSKRGDSDADMHEKMEWRGAVVEEEPWNLATDSTSLFGWPTYKPSV